MVAGGNRDIAGGPIAVDAGVQSTRGEVAFEHAQSIADVGPGIRRLRLRYIETERMGRAARVPGAQSAEVVGPYSRTRSLKARELNDGREIDAAAGDVASRSEIQVFLASVDVGGHISQVGTIAGQPQHGIFISYQGTTARDRRVSQCTRT